MRWTSAKIHVLKAAIIGVTLAYMILDLWVLRGPMYGFLHKDKQTAEAAVVVYGERISHEQLARHKAEQEAISGTKPDKPWYLLHVVGSASRWHKL